MTLPLIGDIFFHDGGVEHFQNVWISHRGPKTLLRLLFCLAFWEALGRLL